MTQSVDPDPIFSMKITPGNESMYTGESGSYTVAITPGDRFALDVALSCVALPPATSCTFSPAIVHGDTGLATVVVQTAPPGKHDRSECGHSG